MNGLKFVVFEVKIPPCKNTLTLQSAGSSVIFCLRGFGKQVLFPSKRMFGLRLC